MFEITDSAAEKLKDSLIGGKVIKLYNVGQPDEKPNFALGLALPSEDDKIVERKGVKIHMNPDETENMMIVVVDYLDDERGRGFVVYTDLDGACDMVGCGGCSGCEGDSFN
ncbi:MAG: hypothetical protein ACXQT4_00865 [Methanotrichaceae archaeon]